jgi:riboflavin biosynthesis pyrimidine reductase
MDEKSSVGCRWTTPPSRWTRGAFDVAASTLVRRLLPAPAVEVDVEEAYRAAREPPDDRPWVLVNMIASADGGTTVAGRSGGLGSPGDKEVFRTLRAVADVVLAGAATVRAERYGPPSASAATQDRRRSYGATPVARIAVLSGSLDLDLESPLFASPPSRPYVLTHARSDPARRAELATVADVVLAGEGAVDLADGLRRLRADGVRVVLSEGGPTVNGQLFAADLVDEVCLTVAPMLLAGDSRRVAIGPAVPAGRPLSLTHVLTEDHYLFLRYAVDRTGR